LFLALVAGGALFAACYWTSARARVAADPRRGDELAWLSREFGLADAEIARIRKLHEGYRPKCDAMCARIAAKNAELESALAASPGVDAGIERKLGEIAALRADCQAQMLRHFREVAATMPAESGARYLAGMQRLALGLRVPAESMMVPSHHEHP
jgi:hypothetical protein